MHEEEVMSEISRLKAERDSMADLIVWMVHAVGEIRIPREIVARRDLRVERFEDESTREIVFTATQGG